MTSYLVGDSISIPSIGYGTYPQKETLVENIPIVLSEGYKIIDSSDNYNNEEYVGKGLDQVDRKLANDCFIVSKFSQPMRSTEVESCFEESKTLLGGKLDIYLLHWPYPFLWKMQWRRMEKLYEQGKCKIIGVCNFETKHLKKMLKFCRVKPMINQFERHPYFQQKDTYNFCCKNGIQVMCYSPIARMESEIQNDPVLVEMAAKYNKSVSQIILRWNIEYRCIPIPASKSKSHIQQNYDIFDFSLTDEEVAQIDALDNGKRIRFDPNKRFDLRTKVCFLLYKIKHYGN